MSAEPDARRCYACGAVFSEYENGNPDTHRQSIGNRKWLALLDDSGNVLQETCSQCARKMENEALTEVENKVMGAILPVLEKAGFRNE